MMLAKLSWKNIWRNKVRSGVILGAIAIGLFAGTFIVAFLEGWIFGTIKDDINTNLSYIQIHTPDFQANNDIGAYFDAATVALCHQQAIPTTSSERLIVTGMLQSANDAVGIMAKGVKLEQEKKVSTIWQTIPDSLGTFLTADVKMPIVISQRTAQKLKVKLKSKIVFTFQNANQEMQTVAFRVGGIFKTSSAIFDEGTVFVRYEDIFPLTDLPEGVIHEAALCVTGVEDLAAIQATDELFAKLKTDLPKLDIQRWRELSPSLDMYMQWINFFATAILGIFLFALSFGIINTMLMAILERTKELGMLQAIGMKRYKIFSMIMLETLFLTILGSAIGIVLSTALLLPTLHSGIDISLMVGDTYEDFGFSSIVYPVINLTMFIQIAILVFAAGIASAIYPAIKALKINMIKAIKME